MKNVSSFLASAILMSNVLSAYANGFYIGAGGGYDVTDFYKTLNIEQNNVLLYDKEDHQTGTGYLGNALLGYEFDIGKAFIDAQLDGSVSNITYNGWFQDYENAQSSTATYKMNKAYGVSILPGYYLNKNVGLFGRVGYERGDFDYSEYKQDGDGPQYGISESEWLNGFLLGLGARIPFNDHLALQFEYDHIWYETFTDTAFPIAGRTINLRPNSNQVLLDLIYRF